MTRSNLHKKTASDIDLVAERYAVAITPQMQELIDAESCDGPVSRQFLPDARELEQDALDSFLPLCEERDVAVLVGGGFNSGVLATGAIEGARYNYAPAPPDMLSTPAPPSSVPPPSPAVSTSDPS